MSMEEEGCMGGFMHLFDFNHSMVSRKMITSKKTGGGKSPYVYVYIHVWMNVYVCVCVCVCVCKYVCVS